MKKPTMREIGKAVGVSAVTVSKAIAGKPGMSDEMRKKILAKAEEVGYTYPDAGRMTGPAHLDIGVLVPEAFFGTNSFYAAMYKRLVQQLTDAGHFTLLELLDRQMEENLEVPKLIGSRRVDGLILLGEPTKGYYRMIAQQNVPAVFLDFYDGQASADAVVGDNSYGCYRLASHLIKNGHRKIGFVGNYRATSSIMDRFLGYVRAMMANDLPVRDDWVIMDRSPDNQLLERMALPLVVILACQVVMMVLFVRFIAFPLLGRDYDAAVLCAGFCGFGLGATPNAMANMSAVCYKYRYTVKPFLIVPIIGAMFLDIINAGIITLFLNFLK